MRPGLGGFDALEMLRTLFGALTGETRPGPSTYQQPQAQGPSITQRLQEEFSVAFGGAVPIDSPRNAPQADLTWGEASTYLDLLDDPGIAGERQMRGVDEGWGQGGALDMILRLAGDAVWNGQPYASPYNSEEDGGSAEAFGVTPAHMGERMAGGLLVPGGGMADMVQGGFGVAKHADDLLGLALGATSRTARSADEFAGAAGTVFRTLDPSEAERYVEATTRLTPDRQAFLTPKTPDAIRDMLGQGGMVRMTDDGVGYILDPAGDLQGVINSSGRPGAGRDAIRDAIFNGARTLDAYDGKLTEIYSEFGFRETGRAPFNPDWASPQWDTARYGEPDVVFMAREGVPTATDVDRVAEVLSRVPEEYRGLVQSMAVTLDSNAMGISPARAPLARKVVDAYDAAGNVIGRMPQGELQTQWVQQTLDNMTPETLDRWAGAIRNGISIEDGARALDIGGGTVVQLRHWYDTDPVLRVFNRALGDEEGTVAYRTLMGIIAATSPRTQVRENVEHGLALSHHVGSGKSLREVAMLAPEQYSGAVLPTGYNDSMVPVGAGQGLRHAEYTRAADGTLVPKRESDALQGTLGQVLTGQQLSGQKVSTFYPNTVDPSVGGTWTSLTVDSHNLRQTLNLSGVPLATGADRLALARAWGIADLNALKPFFEDAVIPVGKKRVLAAADVERQFADTLYAQAITRTGLYGVIEDFQRGVMRKLGELDPSLVMDEAPFQARLWTGANEASQVADSVPLAGAIIESLYDWGARRLGTTDLDTIVQNVWRSEEGINVLYEAARVGGNFDQLGISNVDDFRALLARGSAKATTNDEEHDPLSLLGLGSF